MTTKEDIIVLRQTTDGFLNRVVGYRRVKSTQEAEEFVEKAHMQETNVIKIPYIYTVLDLNELKEIKLQE